MGLLIEGYEPDLLDAGRRGSEGGNGDLRGLLSCGRPVTAALVRRWSQRDHPHGRPAGAAHSVMTARRPGPGCAPRPFRPAIRPRPHSPSGPVSSWSTALPRPFQLPFRVRFRPFPGKRSTGAGQHPFFMVTKVRQPSMRAPPGRLACFRVRSGREPSPPAPGPLLPCPPRAARLRPARWPAAMMKRRSGGERRSPDRGRRWGRCIRRKASRSGVPRGTRHRKRHTPLAVRPGDPSKQFSAPPPLRQHVLPAGPRRWRRPARPPHLLPALPPARGRHPVPGSSTRRARGRGGEAQLGEGA